MEDEISITVPRVSNSRSGGFGDAPWPGPCAETSARRSRCRLLPPFVQASISRRRRVNRSEHAYAASVWFRTTCASAVSITLPRVVGPFQPPIPEAGPEAMRHRRDAQLLQHARQSGVGDRLAALARKHQPGTAPAVRSMRRASSTILIAWLHSRTRCSRPALVRAVGIVRTRRVQRAFRLCPRARDHARQFRRGPKKATVAVAASMLTAAYFMLRDEKDEHDLGGRDLNDRDNHRITQRLPPASARPRRGGRTGGRRSQHPHHEFSVRRNLVRTRPLVRGGRAP